MIKEREYAFHQWTVRDVERHFDVTTKEGLSEKRAHFRLQKKGPNSLSSLKETTAWRIFLNQFSNFFIILLFAAAVISYFVDGIIQALVLVAIIVVNVSLGFFQEFKAEKALQSLKSSYKSKCKILRDGKIKIVSSEEIVTGDIVVLDTGDLVPADLRIIKSESMRAQESSLTGESLPISKDTAILPIDTPLADRKNILFGSTTLVAGRGKGIVIATGKNTEFGKIAGMISKTEEKTPLEGRILFLGKILTLIAVVIVVILFILGTLRGYELLPLLTFTIALLVSAVPESLPTIITLALAIGVSKMARKKAIVRRLAVIETLGTTDVIATDKTGTLTDNILNVNKVTLLEKNDLTVVELIAGHDPSKEIAEIFKKSILCSNINTKSTGEMMGDPVEVSIAEKAKSFSKGIITKARLYKREMEIPFDSEKKFMAVLVSDQFRQKELIAKGAPEKIISFCSLSNIQKRKIKKTSSCLSKEGLKVIAVASKKISKEKFSNLSGMQFMGLFGLVDEPSEGIREAITRTVEAGIRPIMITGDHPQTARFVANKVGMDVNDDQIICGKDLDKLSHLELKKALKKVKIFARVTPEDKINIVKTLEDSGYSVAVTGDGVNDAPAIKEASVGIAMGIKGTDVARESADIVLSDDKYSTIVSAVEYGRTVYDNIKNAVTHLLSGNFDELFLIGFAFIFNLPMPLLTLQILWINMVTDSFPALALAFEEPSKKILSDKPRSAKISSMKYSIIYALCLAAVGFTLGILLFLWGLGHSVDKARTLVFTFAVVSELVYVFSIRSPERIWENVRSFFTNKYMIAAISFSLFLQVIIFIKPLQKIFGIVSLNLTEISVLIASIVIAFLAAEIIRWKFDKNPRFSNFKITSPKALIFKKKNI